jgi:uncharacterized protein YkwD
VFVRKSWLGLAALALTACTVQPLTPDPAWTQAVALTMTLPGPVVERAALDVARNDPPPTIAAPTATVPGATDVSQIPTAIPYASPTRDPAQVTAPATEPVVLAAAVLAASPTARRPAPTAVSAGDPSSPVPATAVSTMPSPTVAPDVLTPGLEASAAPSATATQAPPPAAPGGDVASAEQYTIDLINQHRAAAGVSALLRDEALMAVARGRVADMVARGYTGHNDPVTGVSLGPANIRAAGFTSPFVGENWYGTIRPPPTNVDVAMSWFMTDPPHARNILSPNYVYVGVGIAYNGRQWLLIQNFAGAN